jgi:uncharacterized protein
VKFKNQLIYETSPYLLQHAYNPVNWYPWNNEALELAKKQNKMLIISIGYSACHWCHVMENESFEDPEIASLMNDNFICIKVDKEERPDIDLIYMEAVQLISGQGGWPLNCFATPDGKPFYGGTYFNKKQWDYVLNQIADLYKNNKEKISSQAKKLTNALSKNEFISIKKQTVLFNNNYIQDSIEIWKDKLDPLYGGLKGQQKFPMPASIDYLLSYYHLSNDKKIFSAISIQLEKMMHGGIYDQIQGGFSRYTVDKKWIVPHFEKMLYDNAQLLSTYSNAFILSGNYNYTTVIHETINFLTSEMQDKNGLFYCALDADSEGVEGKYYVWKHNEFSKTINNDFILELYNISKEGNWENGENILHITKPKNELIIKHNLEESQANQQIIKAKSKLLALRNSRTKPNLDNKIITSWNALLIVGLLDSYKATKNELAFNLAINMGEYFKNSIIKSDGSVIRSLNAKKSNLDGFLDDYANTIKAFISLYTATFNEIWLTKALLLLDYTIKNFSDEKKHLFYYTAIKEESLITRKMEITDNVMPSSNSQMAINLYVLGLHSQNQKHIERAKIMSEYVHPFFKENGAHYANWGILINWLIKEPYQLIIVGENAIALKNKINDYFLPNVILSGSEKESDLPIIKNKFKKGETYVYICRENTCLSGLTSIKEVIKIVSHSN